MKPLLSLFCLLLLTAIPYFLLLKPAHRITRATLPDVVIAKPSGNTSLLRLKKYIAASTKICQQKGFSTTYRFFIDMSLPSGKARFFVYNAVRDTIVQSGLVAHGSCNTAFLGKPQFSNTPDCGCSSVGRYRIGGAYEGRFGKAYKLFGLDSTNSNAYRRAIVLHAYGGVPDTETAPDPICNSLGCPMVARSFLNKLSPIIESSKKPVLLWLYN